MTSDPTHSALIASRSMRRLASAWLLSCAAGLAAFAPTVFAQITAPATVPASFEQRFEAARQLAFSGQREQAIAAYSALLVESPDNSDVLLGRGRVYAWQRRWGEAEADLRAATTRAPQYADAWSALGDLYLWSDRPSDAVAAYTRWAELEPTAAAPYLARGRAYRAAGQRAAAQADVAAAAARGAPADAVAALQASLHPPRVHNPLAVVPEGYRWSAVLSASNTDFRPDRGPWSDHSLSVRRYFEHGSLALESLGASRFGRDDRAWVLDAYVDLWPRAYSNLRYQHAPDAVLYARLMRAEVFQGVGEGWELSLGYDRLDFTSRTEIYSLGVGRYFGGFYLRARSIYVPGQASSSVSHRGLVRWYYAGNADDYLQLTAGTGRSSESLSDADTVRHSNRRSVGVVWTRYFSARWGFKLGADHAKDDGDGYTERSLSATLLHRW